MRAGPTRVGGVRARHQCRCKSVTCGIGIVELAQGHAFAPAMCLGCGYGIGLAQIYSGRKTHATTLPRPCVLHCRDDGRPRCGVRMYVPVPSALLGAGVVGGTDDAGLVAQLRGDDRRIDVDERHEVVALAAHATTDDDQRGAEVLFDQAVVLGQTLGRLLVASSLRSRTAEDA